ncbi:MAG: hypothetical protein A2161_00750 [Candidatus Schekmanbacteria bacterium RBG_13_48_7]|uniref:Prepilin-type N-terminal cleavage/methylation domain-containing protein n=1 Tax=Candidatus Schekmanbacteria bacterium RBG_13_48_7 TaxID=1817878 RepID=A0A1F7RVR3_9BACT|nr:MAG: hypothetical protein A2161_00750 [Candidatus Schekmanbacteria bacterium RBG_13_48_7]
MKMQHKKFISNDKAGFSLVEILVSITILAVGLMGIASLFPVAGEKIRVADMEGKALYLAEQGIEKARSLSYGNLNDANMNVPCTSAGTTYEDYGCIEEYPEFSRQCTVNMASDSQGNPLRDVKMVTVEVKFRLKFNTAQTDLKEQTVALVDYIGESFKIR